MHPAAVDRSRRKSRRRYSFGRDRGRHAIVMSRRWRWRCDGGCRGGCGCRQRRGLRRVAEEHLGGAGRRRSEHVVIGWRLCAGPSGLPCFARKNRIRRSHWARWAVGGAWEKVWGTAALGSWGLRLWVQARQRQSETEEHFVPPLPLGASGGGGADDAGGGR
eukprot:361279-Chlamydomonas_euryale.AAC.6